MKQFHAWLAFDQRTGDPDIYVYQDEEPGTELTNNPTARLICEDDELEPFLSAVEPWFHKYKDWGDPGYMTEEEVEAKWKEKQGGN